MVQLQETKSALDKGSMQKLTKEERKKTRITTLKDLFQVEKDLDQKWEGWYKDEEEDNNAKTSRDSLSMATILSRFLDSSLATWGDWVAMHGTLLEYFGCGEKERDCTLYLDRTSVKSL